MFFNVWENRVLGNKEDLVIGLNQLDQEIRADERAKIIEMLKAELHPCLNCPSYSTDECDSEEYFEDCCVSEKTISFYDIAEFIKKLKGQNK